jgi:hypothetical protein
MCCCLNLFRSVLKRFLKLVFYVETDSARHFVIRKYLNQSMRENYFDNVYYNCIDKPYGLMSNELLIDIRMHIEGTKNFKEKLYLSLLEDYVTLLDYLCHDKSRLVLINYIRKLNKYKLTEHEPEFQYIIKLLMKALKLGLKEINVVNRFDLKELKNFKRYLIRIEQKHRNFKFVLKCCEIIRKLPILAFTRRGLKINESKFG